MVPRTNPSRIPGRTLLFLLAAAPASCDRHPAGPPRPLHPVAAPLPGAATRRAWFIPSPQQGAGLHLAYRHEISLQLPAAALPAHFAAARDRCLNPATHCILLSASLSTEPTPEDGGSALQHADLQLRLPHDQVAPFANALTEPLPGEPAGEIRVMRQSTEAADLGGPTTDVAQRVNQLTEYLASLKAMAQRLTISVSDLVKIESETAQAQTQIEQAQAEQRDLALRVDTEELSIDFEPAPQAIQPAPDPITQTLAGTNETLRRSAADALQVTIEALPWVPLALVGLLALLLVRLALFGRSRPRYLAANSPNSPRRKPGVSAESGLTPTFGSESGPRTE
jgi:hypothetical protein